MIYTYSHPQNFYNEASFKPIDIAPIEARLWLIHELIIRLLDLGLTKPLLPLAQKARRLVRVLVRASAHNLHIENKFRMLRNPLWRERVLRDLGGMHKLKLWDAAMLRARAGLPAMRRSAGPSEPEPIWWRSPERVAESERLKARFRLCMDATVNKGQFRDPYKMDSDGQFRLAPIPRMGARIGAPVTPLPRIFSSRIYSKVDICEYNYNAIPVQKPESFGPALIWPLEFYTAMTLEVEEDMRGLNGVLAMIREVRVTGEAFSIKTLSIEPHSIEPLSEVITQIENKAPPSFVSTDACENKRPKSEMDDTPEDIADIVADSAPDFLPLPIFLGVEIHEALFCVPP